MFATLPLGLPLDPLPAPKKPTPGIPHAPVRVPNLSRDDFKLAVKNALRYFPTRLHEVLAPEFAQELATYGHIYMYRFMPDYEIRAYPFAEYAAVAKHPHAAAIMLMVHNNLDPAVAQFPEELITYGGNGSVFSNWAQYHLTMQYLCNLGGDQTLSLTSGHPAGLFPSGAGAPRMVITNGMVIPNYSSKEHYDRLYALGVSQYGQMTAGSFCYIGPQGIVHGTCITVLNAFRKYYALDSYESRAGKVYVSSGLGGMSGAQGKAGRICGAITVVAEVNRAALDKRKAQGWVDEAVDDLDACVARMRSARDEKKPLVLAYHGNIVALLERLAQEPDLLAELGSDQTSLHNPFNGGYYPVQLSFDEANAMMRDDPARFRELVQESLRRHVAAVNKLCAKGMRFWDYGNCFLLEASRAGADVLAQDAASSGGPPKFRYPSYVEEFMGDIFSLGFGPFRWVCTSGNQEDLVRSDAIAADVVRRLMTPQPAQQQQAGAAAQALDECPPVVSAQYADNLLWIEQAHENRLVVGSQARILYADAMGRVEIARALNAAIADGTISAPVVLSRDHHDVSGTDSPFRETANVTDGSSFCADMAVQNAIGDSFRGATWVALHNGGGVGWGEVINGGFGLVLDGTPEAEGRAVNMLAWDVNNGVARRAWAGNANAKFALSRSMQINPKLQVTVSSVATPDVLEASCAPLLASVKH